MLLVVVLVAGGSYAYSVRQKSVYSASADVLLSRQNLAASLNNVTDPGSITSDYNRASQTQADLASSPAVIRRALELAGLPAKGERAAALNWTAKAKPNADILTFTVENGDRGSAVKLANAYARGYTAYRLGLDSAGVNRALSRVRQRLTVLRAAAKPNRALITSLSSNEDRLSTLEAFQASNASVVRLAQAAGKVRPEPSKALLIGLLLGGILAIGLALLRDRLDTRVRDPEEIVDSLNLPLLARIPELPRRQRQAHDLVMVSEPQGHNAESFRTLRTNLEFVTLDGAVKTVMVTSAVQAEGKSTVAANLAVAYARAGREVILIDLDLRRPYLALFFGLTGRPGVTDVALDRLTLREAIVEVDITLGREKNLAVGGDGSNGAARDPEKHAMVTRVGDHARGSLRVLPSGPMPPDTGEFLASQWLRQVIDELKGEADMVIVDTPPLLSVNDAFTLSAQVDAVLLVARLTVIRRSMLKEVRRMLDLSPAHVLGCAVSGVRPELGYYGYGYGYTATNSRVGTDEQEEQRPPAPVAARSEAATSD